MSQAPSDRLRALLEEHRGERHLIVLHDYPDPDAISAAYAHRAISAGFEIETDLCYGGMVSHQENLALVHLLGIEMMPFDEAMDLDAYNGSVFVDSQGTTTGTIVDALEEAGVPTLVVVDHHEKQERLEPEFFDCRRVGATATIYAEYLESGLLELDEGKREHVAVATALLHGILSDTGGFLRAGPEDFRAAAFLSRLRDADLLQKIMTQERSKHTMEVIRRALEERRIVESHAIAGIGYLRADDRDAIPQAADFLLSEENVHTVIVYGIVQGGNREETVIGSLRTSKLTLDTDRFLKEVLGQTDSGDFYGGGKRLAGGFEVPLGFLEGEGKPEQQELKWQVFDARIKQAIYEHIGADFEPEDEGGKE